MVFRTWTEPLMDALTDAHAAGNNSSQCAALLSMSRNAIISKAKNMGLKWVRKRRATGPRKPRGPRKAVGAVRMHTPKFNAPAVMPVAPRPKPVVLKAPVPLRTPLAETDGCKYPVDQVGKTHLFCGAKSDGPWCPYHRSIVYEPLKKRVR